MRTVLFVCILFISASAWGSDSEKAFERLLSLQGTWEGSFQGETIQLIYEPISGRTALMEKMIWVPDGSSMTTIYHPQGDRLMATHYCKANQPRLVAVSGGSPDTLTFDFMDGAKPGEKHLSGLQLRLIQENQLEQTVRFSQSPDAIKVLYTRKE